MSVDASASSREGENTRALVALQEMNRDGGYVRQGLEAWYVDASL